MATEQSNHDINRTGMQTEAVPVVENIPNSNGKISIDGKVMREEPGFLKRMWHNMGISLISKKHFTDPIYKQIATQADSFVYSLGLSKDEARQVGVEVAEQAKMNGIKDPYGISGDKMDVLLRSSKTFCSTNEGLSYIDNKFGLHSRQELRARELAAKLKSEMPELNIKLPSKTAQSNFDFGLVLGTSSSWTRSFIDPKDFKLQREAANLAFSMGMSERDSKLVGEEVFKKADSLTGSDKNYNLNDLLAQSPTFSSYEQGVQYLQRAKLDMAVDQIHQNNNDQMQAQADREKVQAANKLRQQYGIDPLQGKSAGADMSIGGLAGAMAGQATEGNNLGQSGTQNSIGGFMNSPLGRILMAVAGFFLTKLLGGGNITGLLIGGVGGMLSPVLGNLFNGFGNHSNMAQQGIEQLQAYDRQQQLSEARSLSQGQSMDRQQEMRNDRGIEDRSVEQQGIREMSNLELMNVVREKGIDGVHAYFGADEKKFNEFITRNNLNEVACNESKVRLEGGDWLKATREGLAVMKAGTSMPSQGAEISKHLSV